MHLWWNSEIRCTYGMTCIWRFKYSAAWPRILSTSSQPSTTHPNSSRSYICYERSFNAVQAAYRSFWSKDTTLCMTNGRESKKCWKTDTAGMCRRIDTLMEQTAQTYLWVNAQINYEWFRRWSDNSMTFWMNNVSSLDEPGPFSRFNNRHLK